MITPPRLWLLSVLPVWLLTLGGTLWALLQGARSQSLMVVLVVGVLATFVSQLATGSPAGFLARTRASVLGVAVCVSVGGLVLLLIPA